jgi:hypothetical protein
MRLFIGDALWIGTDKLLRSDSPVFLLIKHKNL